VLDTPPEAAYDDITELAARYFDAPIALVSLIDRDRQWFKSRVGLAVEQTPRDIAFCNAAIRSADVTVVADAQDDARFAHNPLVTGAPGIRFYAGAPLVTPDGFALGTLCVIDRQVRSFSDAQRDALVVLSRQVMAHLELRKRNAELYRCIGALQAEHDRLQRTRAQLEESDARMRLVLKGSNDGWWDWNLVTGRKFIAARGWQMLGYADEELPYDAALWTRLVYPEDRARAERLLREALASDVEHYAFELRLQHKEGHAVSVHRRGFILRDDQRRAIRVSGTDTDLSERKRTELALRSERELNEQIFANAPIGIAIYDGDGNCVAANRAIAQQVGARREEIMAQNLHRIETWRSSGIYELAMETLESLEPNSRVVNFRTSFGKLVWLAVNFRVLLNDDVGRLMLMTDDLSEFKRAEAARREIQEAYELLFDNGMDGVLQTRVDGSILAANPAACGMLELGEDEIRQRGMAGLIDDTDGRWSVLLAERTHSGRARGVVSMLRGNGDRFDAEVAWATYQDREGRLLASAMVRDVTERRVMARKLEDSFRLLDELTQRVPGVIYQYRRYPDGHSCFPFASAGLWDIYEVTPEQVREDASIVLARLHPDDYVGVVQSITESAATLQPWSADYRVILPVQGLRWRQGNAQPETLADGSTLWHGFISDITERKQEETNTHRLAYFDALTGLPNRGYLLDRVEQALATARRHGQNGALLFLDLDNFKRINDARGHSVGDGLLEQVAQRLSELLRSVDMVARLGGDEFVVLINDLGPDPDTAARAAMGVAEKVRIALEQPYTIDDHLYSGTGSIGLTMFPKGSEGVDDLLREADTAMYRAKAAGRNRIVYFEAAMQAEVEDRLALEQDLKNAIEAGQMRVFVQPQVDEAGVEVGGECLLRWHHPVRGDVPPARFIPIAEESGLILQLGQWVLGRAGEAIARLRGAGASLTLAVNISPREFLQEDFVERVRAVLSDSGVDGRWLVLEVTENLLIENWEAVAQRMARLTAIGVRFSIDDFGTGYSSLAYLKKLPLHEIKIDRSFVKDIPTDPSDTAIVRSILSIAGNLKLQVVAEGVETREQVDFLVANRCDRLQGYFHARPMPLEEWLARLPVATT
jgi:diguanylate cyclase (GGDEF)-like protein/PAS domain S-box-containing protein